MFLGFDSTQSVSGNIKREVHTSWACLTAAADCVDVIADRELPLRAVSGSNVSCHVFEPEMDTGHHVGSDGNRDERPARNGQKPVPDDDKRR